MNKINIKALRTRKGLTQEGLARKVGVGLGTVIRWDKGGQPYADKLPKLVRVFELDQIEDLYESIDDRILV